MPRNKQSKATPPAITRPGARRVTTKPAPGQLAEPAAPKTSTAEDHDQTRQDQIRAEKPPHY